MTPTPISIPAAGISRRRVLTVGGLTVLGAVVQQSLPGRAWAEPPPSAGAFEPTGSVIAFLTDSHADPENSGNLARLRSTLARIADLDPDLVIDGGDVTEYGSPEEFEAHLSLVPASIQDRYFHVVGNHESRWDATAYETYERYLGERNRSLSLDDLHLVLLDSTYVQQDKARMDAATLAWLEADLAENARGKQVLLFQHYPMNNGTYYVSNAEQLLKVLEPYDVRAAFMGHTHRQALSEYNGMTQVVGRATLNDAGYYRLTRGRLEGREVLQVDYFDITEPPGDAVIDPAVPLVTIDMGPRAATLAPYRTRVRVEGEMVSAQVRHHPEAGEAEVAVAVYDPRAWGGSGNDEYTPGTAVQQGRSRTWTAGTSISALVPGAHRVIIRSTAEDGRTWRTVQPFTKKGGGYRPLWKHEMAGTIKAGLASIDGLVVAASSGGEVTAFRPRDGRPELQWSRGLGPVWIDPVFTADGATVLVGSSDHTLQALDVEDGSTRWSTDLGQPIVSGLLVDVVAGRESVVVMANRSMCCLDAATGELRWRQELTQPSMGTPATDGERIFYGGGDGRCWAVEAATGESIWSVQTVSGSNTYGRMIYGCWDTAVTLVGDDLVMFGDYTKALTLRRTDGSTAWQLAGGLRHLPGTPVGDQLLVVAENGAARMVDPDTGAIAWEAQTAPSVATADVQIDPGSGASGTAWVTGLHSQVHQLDLATGGTVPVFRAATQPVMSTPALVDGQLLVADVGGTVQAFELRLQDIPEPRQLADPIEQSTISVHDVSSEETASENGAATNVLDGSRSTIWHTRYSSDAQRYPHHITLDLGHQHEVTGLEYVQRQIIGANGQLAGYEVAVSTDAQSWSEPVATGTFSEDLAPQVIDLEPTQGRYVRLTGLSAINGGQYGGAAEIRIGGTPS